MPKYLALLRPIATAARLDAALATLPDWKTTHDELGFSMLGAAIRLRRDHLIELLLERGADPNGADADGQRPCRSRTSSPSSSASPTRAMSSRSSGS